MNLRAWVTVAALLIAVGGIAGAISFLPTDDDAETCARAKPDAQGFVSTDYDGRLHTEDEIDYCETPPMGGQHDPEWLDCGVYDQPVREENAVHSLEHGTVWITYSPDIPAADVDALAAVLPDKGILSPYDGLPTPVVVTVWDRQQHLDGAADPRLQEFLDEYADGDTAPEAFATCEGGIEAFED